MGSGSSKKKDKEAGSGYSRETPPVATSPAATQPDNAPSLNTSAVDVSGSASPDSMRKSFKSLNCSVLGIQGAGKSTVIKQFCHEYGTAGIDAEENTIVKKEILDCVITRTKHIIHHLCFKDDEPGKEHKTDESLIPIMDAFDDLTSTYADSDHLDQKQLAEVLGFLKTIWTTAEVLKAHTDAKIELEIENSIGKSAEIQQKFISGKFFVDNVSAIMAPGYMLTRDEYVNVRIWTRDVASHNLTYGPIDFTIRDVGGDELSRTSGAWEKAIKESFCVLFIISLDDYDRIDTGSDNKEDEELDPKKTRFRAAKNLLWKYVLHEDNQARFVLLLNKRDRFREKLALVPLHEASHHFRSFPAPAEAETHKQYCVRCEEEVVKFFLHSSRVKSKEHADKHLATAEFTHATDKESFGLIMQKLCLLFKEIWDEKLSEFGFIG